MFKRLAIILLVAACFGLNALVMAQDPTPPALPEEPMPNCPAFVTAPQESRIGYYMGEGSAYLNNRQLVLAKNSFACIIRVIDPNYAPGWLGRARANLLLAEYDSALIDLNRAIQLNPDFVAAHNDRGYLMVLTDQYAQAESNFERALQIDENYAIAFNNLAVVYVLQAKHNDAITLLEEKIDDTNIDGVLAQLRSPDYDPENPILFRHLDARLYALMGIAYEHQALQNFRNYTDLFNRTGQHLDERIGETAGALESRFRFELRLNDGSWLLLSDYPADAGN